MKRRRYDESTASMQLSGGSVVDGPSTSTCASCGIAEVDEIKLMTWWVDKLPEGKILKDQTLAQMGAPEEILAAAEKGPSASARTPEVITQFQQEVLEKV